MKYDGLLAAVLILAMGGIAAQGILANVREHALRERAILEEIEGDTAPVVSR